MKNWITFRHGKWFLESGNLEWKEDGTVSIDPAAVTSVAESDNVPYGCVIMCGRHTYGCKCSRQEMIAQIQSALT